MVSGRMFNWAEEWHMSFAGCGFRSIYYVGALSCILERVPRLVQGASTFGGASSGCLVAAAMAVGIPIGEPSFVYCTLMLLIFLPLHILVKSNLLCSGFKTN